MTKHSANQLDLKPIGRSNLRVNSVKEIQISYEGRDETVVVKPPNLSRGGMFINTSQTFPEGAILNLHFELLHTGAQIHTRCEVRYCRPGIGVGVEFIGLPAEAARFIDEEIGMYEETTAREKPRRRKPKTLVPIPRSRRV